MVCIFSETVTSQNAPGAVMNNSALMKGLTLEIIAKCGSYTAVLFNFQLVVL